MIDDHNDNESAADTPGGRRSWKHIHHSPIFWIGVVLFLAAIAVYVLTDDLSWRPHIH